MGNSYKEFLKTQYPNNYSDSVEDPIPSLNKESLSFFLGSLSSLSKEHEFESFCRTLVRAADVLHRETVIAYAVRDLAITIQNVLTYVFGKRHLLVLAE